VGKAEESCVRVMHFAFDIYNLQHVQETAVYKEFVWSCVIFRAVFRTFDAAGLLEELRQTGETVGMSAGKYLWQMRSLVVSVGAHSALEHPTCHLSLYAPRSLAIYKL
jgi:hypothetical protein